MCRYTCFRTRWSLNRFQLPYPARLAVLGIDAFTHLSLSPWYLKLVFSVILIGSEKVGAIHAHIRCIRGDLTQTICTAP